MKIAIIGLGGMGSWLAREMLATGHEIAAFDIRPHVEFPAGARRLEQLREIRQYRPDMLINAVTIHQTVPVFQKLSLFLPHDCMLVDITSIKDAPAAYYRGCKRPFASIHPMFGPVSASARTLSGESMIIINESCPAGKHFFHTFGSARGLHCREMSFEEHDHMMAHSLTLPFATSLAFAACMDGGEVPGTTFARHRELARTLLREDDDLLVEILFNRYSLDQIDSVCGRLRFLRQVIAAGDHGEAEGFIARLRENTGVTARSASGSSLPRNPAYRRPGYPGG
ncbi:MAG TPA: prephenate dehydrogenase [Candidatus Aminicenantes bacterium]|nr:prephenate dehydrogenase [Candidatus Aminicenantes bacterium]